MSNAEPRWDRPILMGCAPSSGSTLLSVMLDAHPEVMCGPELSLFSHPYFWNGEGAEWATRLHHVLDPNIAEQNEAVWEWDGGRGFVPYVGAVYESALEWYQADVNQIRGSLMAGLHPQEAVKTIMSPRLKQTGKPIWAEKSPPNVYSMKSFLKRYPNGRGILVVRDGRDVVCSLLKRDWNFWRAAATWLVETALCMQLSRDRRILIVKYEDLVADSTATLKKVCEFLEVSDASERMANYTSTSDRSQNDPSILMKAWTSRPDQPVQKSSVDRWKKELTPLQLGMLASATVIRNVPGLEEIGGVSFPEALKFFGYSELTAPNMPISEGEVFAYAQSLAPPGFPAPFPMTHVDFPPLSGGRQLVGGMLFWIWGQVEGLQRKNKELEFQLEVMRGEKQKLQYKLQMKTGRVGGMREFLGRNKELDAT